MWVRNYSSSREATKFTARGSTKTPTAIPAGTEGSAASAASAAMNKLAAPKLSPECVVPKPTMLDNGKSNSPNPIMAIERSALARLSTSHYLSLAGLESIRMCNRGHQKGGSILEHFMTRNR
jgi:hypothetical protein